MGIGPGSLEDLTPRARRCVESADVVVGYATYVDLVRPIIKPGAKVIRGRMGGEVERARAAISAALGGSQVAVISGGDPGVYGMAGVVLEAATVDSADVCIDVIPGVTAATAAAARLGAPLSVDFAVISLSDLLTPWDLIEKRLEAASEGDFVIVLYNPQSKGRREPLAQAHSILLRHRHPETPVGIVRNAGRGGEEVEITNLERMLDSEIDMVTTVIVGNSSTLVLDGRMVTPRGYDLRSSR
ncbi:MAG: precorrin-3B C(17)-methyltransferase [Candidatus Verstraetearchaeota archaeon]|nr:precorrin-3B C(17)-methyltransferase [Candidatus Verstraetearchaeota archaeon]